MARWNPTPKMQLLDTSGAKSHQEFLKQQQFVRSPEYMAKKRAQMEQNDLRLKNAIGKLNSKPQTPKTGAQKEGSAPWQR